MSESTKRDTETVVEDYLNRLLGRLIGKGKENKLLHFDAGRALTVTSPSFEALYDRIVKNEETLTFRHEVTRSDDLATYRLLRLFEMMGEPVRISLGDIATNVVALRDQERKLKNLRNRARRLLEETGIRVLYLSFGLLHWIREEEEICSPLVLVPVTVSQETARHPFTLSLVHDDILVNSALSYYLEKESGILLPEIEKAESAADLIAYLNAVEALVAPRSWHIERTVALGEQSYLKLAMHRDGEENRARLLRHPFFRALSHAEPMPEHPVLVKDSEPAAIDCYHVLPTDSSQEELIRYSRAGYSAVMIGPPGTGKSQTIANIIANAMADGKRILFVSEKQAALEVVHQRLTEAGLADFCLALHNHRASRRTVINDIASVLQLRNAPYRVDRSQLHELADLDFYRAKLASYTEALHRVVEPFGYSPYQIYARYLSVVSAPTVLVPRDTAVLTHERFRDDCALLARYCETRAALGVSVPSRTLAYFKTEGARFGFDTDAVAEAEKTLSRLSALLSDERAAVLSHYVRTLSYTALRTLLTRLLPFLTGEALPLSLLDGSHAALAQEIEALAKEEARLSACERELTAAAPDATLTEELSALLTALSDNVRPLLPHFPLLRGMTVGKVEELCDRLALAHSRAAQARTALAAIGSALGYAFPETEAGCDDAVLAAEELIAARGVLRLDVSPSVLRAIEKDSATVRELEDQLLLYFKPEFLTMPNPEGVLATLQRAMQDWAYSLRSSYRTVARELGEYLLSPTVTRDAAFFVAALTNRVTLDEARARLAQNRAKIGAGDETDAEALARVRAEEERTRLISRRLGGTVPAAIRAGLSPRALLTLGSDAALLSTALTEGVRAVYDCGLPSSAFLALGQLPTHAEGLRSALTRAARLLALPEKTVREITDALLLAERTQTLRTRVRREADRVREALGGTDASYGDPATFSRLLSRAAAFAALSPSPALLSAVSESTARTSLYETVTALLSVMEEGDTTLSPVLSALSEEGRELPVEQLIPVLHEGPAVFASLDDIAAFGRVLARLREEGFGEYIAALERMGAEEHAVSAYQKAVLGAWFSAVCERESALADFRESAHRDALEKYLALDTKSRLIATARIRESLIGRLPSSAVQRRNGGEIAVLNEQVGRGSTQMSLRRLFRAIPTILPRLKPCFMMSPMSVAHLLNADDYHFDLVIFDEASQIFPEDAVGAILRADSVIIAGDPNQLPPSNFFRKKDENAAEGEESEGEPLGESILESATGILPRFDLLWHYRSRDERLIDFSNRNVYKDAPLITFPGNLGEEDTGVEYVYLPDGVYEKGVNRREAEECVRLIREHFDRHPSRSLGVIAFGEKQENAIEEAVVAFRAENPAYERFFREDEHAPFFIKNLESVQGDERDTILLSIGYARDAEGKFNMKFGPLNWPGGERRLNVAVTRAKYNVKLIGSILPTDIDSDKVKNEGPKMLRRYIEYARCEQENDGETAASPLPFTDTFADLVEATVRAAGYDVVRNLGASAFKVDLAVRRPEGEGYLCAILPDGVHYASAKTVRDRDHVRVSVLENAMGFPVIRVYSTEWMRRPAETAERLLSAIEALRTQESTAPEASATVSFEVPLEDPTYDGDDPYGLAEYVTADLMGVPSLRPEDGYAMEAAARYVLDIEAPMHISLLLERLSPLFPGKRATAACVQALREAISHMKAEYRLPDGEGIIRAVRGRRTAARRPRADEKARSAVCIPIEEITDCLSRILHVIPGEMEIEFLEKECVHAMGLGSRHAQVRRLLSTGRALLVARGETVEHDGMVRLR